MTNNTQAVTGSNVIAPAMHNGELRILDTDLATRLGFSNPTMIRKLIGRHSESLSQMGVVSTVEITSGTRGGRPGTAHYLNEEQALFITAKSETAKATKITIEIVTQFAAFKRGEPTVSQPSLSDRQRKAISILRVAEDEAAAFIRKRVNDAVLVMQGHEDLVTVPTPSGKVTPKQMREAVGLFRSLQYVNKLSGMDKNNALLSANRQVKETTGIDLLKNSGATHLLAHETDHALTPTAIGKRLGDYGAQRINGALAHLGYQEKKSVGKADAWVPTSKGEPHSIMEDTGKKRGDGTPVRQLKWKASIVAILEKEMKQALQPA